MIPKSLVLLVSISCVAALGCSGGSAIGKPVTGAFSGSDSEETVLYARAGGASVFSKASMEARLLGKLEPGERVVKIGETKGFTHVRARSGSMIGWVSTSRLGKRLAPAKAKQAEKPGPPDAPPSSSQAIEPEPQSSIEAPDSVSANAVTPAPGASAPESEPMGPQQPHGVGASVFDPY